MDAKTEAIAEALMDTCYGKGHWRNQHETQRDAFRRQAAAAIAACEQFETKAAREIERLRSSLWEFLDMFEARPDMLRLVGVAEGLVIARATKLLPRETST